MTQPDQVHHKTMKRYEDGDLNSFTVEEFDLARDALQAKVDKFRSRLRDIERCKEERAKEAERAEVAALVEKMLDARRAGKNKQEMFEIFNDEPAQAAATAAEPVRKFGSVLTLGGEK